MGKYKINTTYSYVSACPMSGNIYNAGDYYETADEWGQLKVNNPVYTSYEEAYAAINDITADPVYIELNSRKEVECIHAYLMIYDDEVGDWIHDGYSQQQEVIVLYKQYCVVCRLFKVRLQPCDGFVRHILYDINDEPIYCYISVDGTPSEVLFTSADYGEVEEFQDMCAQDYVDIEEGGECLIRQYAIECYNDITERWMDTSEPYVYQRLHVRRDITCVENKNI